MNALWQAGATIIAFDPMTMQEAQRIYANDQNLQLGDDKYSALNDYDACLFIANGCSYAPRVLTGKPYV